MGWYSIKKKFLTFIGDIKWSGILHPFWFTINAKGYQLKGSYYHGILKVIEPGDILLRRFEGYVDKWFVPGWWNHAAIYVGKGLVIHAISEGVQEQDILDFMRTDHMIILRPNFIPCVKKKSINKAKSVVGKPYDFGFDFKNSNRFSCTELVTYCYPSLVKPNRRFKSLWSKVVIPDDIRYAPRLRVVWDSTQ